MAAGVSAALLAPARAHDVPQAAAPFAAPSFAAPTSFAAAAIAPPPVTRPPLRAPAAHAERAEAAREPVRASAPAAPVLSFEDLALAPAARPATSKLRTPAPSRPRDRDHDHDRATARPASDVASDDLFQTDRK
jgi:hypothetical protein